MALNIKAKGKYRNSFGKKSSGFLKIDEYKNHTMILEKVTKIITAKEESEVLEKFKEVDQYLSLNSHENNDESADYNLYNYWKQNKEELDIESIFELRKLISELKVCLQRKENHFHKRIVVAGGFSSGKSSMLNSLMKIGNEKYGKLLPTSIEPTSSISTYIYFSKNQQELEVLGENLNSVLVNLGTEALKSIQHSNVNNSYLAAVLAHIYIKVPSERLDGFAFIDTPGYNNTATKNDFNNKTDEETAKEALVHGDVLFWTIDGIDGTLKTSDLDILKNFKKDIVIVVNKADKLGENASAVVEEVYEKVRLSEISNRVLDIITYSSSDDCCFTSYYNNFETIYHLFDNIKGKVKSTEVELILTEIDKIFINILNRLKDKKNICEKLYGVSYSQWNFVKNDKRNRTDITKSYLNHLKEEYNFQYIRLQEIKKHIETVNRKKNRFIKSLRFVIEEVQVSKKNKSIDINLSNTPIMSIFDAIDSNSMTVFYNAFLGYGVELDGYNSLGYSPMTYAVKSGNLNMVKFFLDENVDPAAVDKRGLNMFETAIENNNRNICRLLLDFDREIMKSINHSKENLRTLINNNSFREWAEREFF